MKHARKVIVAVGMALALAVTAGCTDTDANVVNENLDNDADNFKVLRRVVFYNAIRDKTVLEVEGFCSVDPGDGRRMSVVCKVGSQYKRNALGSSNNMTWWYEQLETSNVSPNHYKFTVKPMTAIPDVEVR